MEYFPAPLEALVEQFARLPGIGGKSAQRLAFFVLSLPEEDAAAFAQAILDARDLYPDASLADLYDPATMPPELVKAHQENDKAVMRAYGFDIKTTTESSCVAELMRRYQELTENASKKKQY